MEPLFLLEAENISSVALMVPYRDRTIVRHSGAQWDTTERQWKVGIDLALTMDLGLEKYWPPEIHRLLPYLLEARRKRESHLTFSADFCFMLEANPDSTREKAREENNVHLRVSPAELKAFLHKRCDRPPWTDKEVFGLKQAMAAAREAINAHFSLSPEDTDTIGLETVPQPYFWGVRVKAWVLREKPSGIGIRIVF